MGKTYIDERRWKYRIMPGIAGGDKPKYKIRYQKPGTVGWKGYPVLPWRESEAEAEHDLEEQAGRKGWKEVE